MANTIQVRVDDPFEIKRATINPYVTLSESEMLEKAEKVRKHAVQGRYKAVADVFRDMRVKYGS